MTVLQRICFISAKDFDEKKEKILHVGSLTTAIALSFYTRDSQNDNDSYKSIL